MTSEAESEGFTFGVAVGCVSAIAATDLDTNTDTSGMPTCKYHLYINFQLFSDVNTHFL